MSTHDTLLLRIDCSGLRTKLKPYQVHEFVGEVQDFRVVPLSILDQELEQRRLVFTVFGAGELEHEDGNQSKGHKEDWQEKLASWQVQLTSSCHGDVSRKLEPSLTNHLCNKLVETDLLEVLFGVNGLELTRKWAQADVPKSGPNQLMKFWQASFLSTI